jgi:hypothetical protein
VPAAPITVGMACRVKIDSVFRSYQALNGKVVNVELAYPVTQNHEGLQIYRVRDGDGKTYTLYEDELTPTNTES